MLLYFFTFCNMKLRCLSISRLKWQTALSVLDIMDELTDTKEVSNINVFYVVNLPWRKLSWDNSRYGLATEDTKTKPGEIDPRSAQNSPAQNYRPTGPVLAAALPS